MICKEVLTMKRVIQIIIILWLAGLLVQPAIAGDFGQTPQPMIITLSSFIAEPADGSVFLFWETSPEIDNVGFNIYRSEQKNGEYTVLNDNIIIAEGSPTEGMLYEFIDDTVQNRKTYYYKLEDFDIYGVSTFHGPVNATPRMIYGIER
jgi:hypothetical protein